jgi:CrcB protein
VKILTEAAFVVVGSSLGGLTRWAVATAASRLSGTIFPIGTFLINIAGSLFIGWFLTVLSQRLLLSESRWIHPEQLRLLVAVGFTGSFTTFSTFEYESYSLLRDGESASALLYIVGSVAVGLIAVRMGVQLAQVR